MPTAGKRQNPAAASVRVRRLASLGALVLAVWCVFAPPALAEAQPSSALYQIIVNPQNPLVSVDREFATQSFLKKVVTWDNGSVIRPVDLVADSAVRRQFSEQVLGRSVSAVRSYWLQIIFSGRGVPPPELSSDDEVVRYVLREPGAMGYVSSRADLHGARAVVVR
jgi:hypothetical protein